MQLYAIGKRVINNTRMKSINNKLEQIIRPTRVNYINLYAAQRAYLPSFTEHALQVKSFDGTVLECLYLEHKDNASGSHAATIVYSHSHGSCKYEAANLIRHCAEFGYDLCLYDSRACGKSGDTAIYFGFKEHLDLLFVLFKLVIAFNRKGFVLWGRSIGCNAVLQLYNALYTNESAYLNKNPKLLASARTSPLKRSGTGISSSSKRDVKYPQMHNKLIEEHLDTFLMHNEKKIYGFTDVTFEFTLYAVVLDSPYTSFMTFLKDNMSKLAGFMTSLVSTPLSHYLKSFYNKKLGIDLETCQNIDLLRSMNVNALFLISDADDMIPYRAYTDMINVYGTSFRPRHEPRVYNTKQRHGAIRADTLISNCLLQIITSMKPSNSIKFAHKSRTSMEFQQLTESKSFMAPRNIFGYQNEPKLNVGKANRLDDRLNEAHNENKFDDQGLRKVKSVYFAPHQSVKSTRLIDPFPYASFKFIGAKESQVGKF